LNSRGVLGGNEGSDGTAESFSPETTWGWGEVTVPASNNRKLVINSISGSITSAGTFSGGQGFADFAELFENMEGSEIPVGSIITLDGSGVRIAQENDNIDGVVSHTAIILANDTSFTWQGRYEKDEFGRLVKEIVNTSSDLDGTSTLKMETPVENPDFDTDMPNIPRSKRPDEWTPVGMIGQVYVRVSKNVKDGDKIKASSGGIGEVSSSRTGLKCMKITTPYDEEKGYAVAKCVINVQV